MTCYLIRHASAGKRTSAKDDIKRKLDKRGLHQAEVLAAKYVDIAPVRIYSSAAPRCVETVAPLADALGLEVEFHPALLEGEPLGPALSLIRSKMDISAAFCSHRSLLPRMLNRLVDGGLTADYSLGFAKGAVWAIETEGDQFVSGTYIKNRP